MHAAEPLVDHRAGTLVRVRQHVRVDAQGEGRVAVSEVFRWLAGCIEYDMGLRTAAEVTRSAAQKLGEEAGERRIVGWSHEMSAWFALTQNRYRDVISASQAAQNVSRSHPVAVQLIAQEAKALARMGSKSEVRARLENGRCVLDSFPIPTRTDNHFVVDPSKWDFYAMDAYRPAGDDPLAVAYAQKVLRSGTRPDGSEIAPMRMAEVRLTLAVAAARQDDLEQASATVQSAVWELRTCWPSILVTFGRRSCRTPSCRTRLWQDR